MKEHADGGFDFPGIGLPFGEAEKRRVVGIIGSKDLSHRKRRWARRRTQLEQLEDCRLLSAGNGLQGHYFDTDDLTGPALVRQDPGVDFDWASGSPDASIASDTFSVRWSGQVEARYTETYSFIVNADDGARLWVNGTLLIDQFESSNVSDATANIDLIAGRRYDLQLEFREITANAAVKLEWSSPSLPRAVIPADALYADARGSILAERWNAVTGNSVADLTGDAAFPDSPSVAAALSSFESASDSSDNFGQRMRGYIHAPKTGPYRFYIAGDESAELWFSNTSDPAQKQLVASVNAATQSQQWFASSTQRSAIFYLAAG